MVLGRKKGQEAIPIFHNVDPSDVRRQSNSVAKALAKLEADLKGSDLGKLQRWKDALSKAANIAGWDIGKTANRSPPMERMHDNTTELHPHDKCLVIKLPKMLADLMNTHLARKRIQYLVNRARQQRFGVHTTIVMDPAYKD